MNFVRDGRLGSEDGDTYTSLPRQLFSDQPLSKYFVDLDLSEFGAFPKACTQETVTSDDSFPMGSSGSPVKSLGESEKAWSGPS